VSSSALHRAHGFRKLCQRCHERKARFQYRGIVRADRDHTLCFECYRSERERQRARSLSPISLRPLHPPHLLHPSHLGMTSPVTAPSYS